MSTVTRSYPGGSLRSKCRAQANAGSEDAEREIVVTGTGLSPGLSLRDDPGLDFLAHPEVIGSADTSPVEGGFGDRYAGSF
jgi:hypothetical protein